jgi:hypothetical protein
MCNPQAAGSRTDTPRCHLSFRGKNITDGRLVYSALTGTNGKARFAMATTADGIDAEYGAVSKSQGHSDVARLKSQPLVKPLRIDTGMMRQQLDQFAFLGARLGQRPSHELFADAVASATRVDADVLDQAARGALRA